MTPKEKANELVSLMLQHQHFAVKGHFNEKSCLNNAKQCALICVDEIIETNPLMSLNATYGVGSVEIYSSNKKYWQEVKQEIEKL